MRDQDCHGIGALLDVSGAAIQAEAVYQPQTACPSRAVDRGRVQVKLHLHRLCQMAEDLAIVDAAAGRTIMNQGHKGVHDHGDGLPHDAGVARPCDVESLQCDLYFAQKRLFAAFRPCSWGSAFESPPGRANRSDQA